MAIRSILLPFRIFYGHLEYFVGVLVYFSLFWYVAPKNLATLNPTIDLTLQMGQWVA
jgi:hypothetical protein